MNKVVLQGIYEHYKSTPKQRRYYQVLFLSHQEDSGEVLVHYQPMYWHEEDDNTIYEDGITIWTRTLLNFSENVTWKGKAVPRFKRVS